MRLIRVCPIRRLFAKGLWSTRSLFPIDPDQRKRSYRDAIRVCAENIAGVKEVRDRIVFVEPFTGAYVDPSELKG
jgi:hypothetical protein